MPQAREGGGESAVGGEVGERGGGGEVEVCGCELPGGAGEGEVAFGGDGGGDVGAGGGEAGEGGGEGGEGGAEGGEGFDCWVGLVMGGGIFGVWEDGCLRRWGEGGGCV